MVGGMTAGHYVWDFVRPQLCGYRTITWEPRGLGWSDCPEPPYGIETWCSDLKALFAALRIERAYLWAEGFGSYYAIRFAREFPDLVAALIAYTDVWAGDPSKSYSRIWPVVQTIVENFGTTGAGARMLAGLFQVPWLPWFTEWEARNVEDVLHAETLEHTVGYCLTEADVRECLPDLKVPVLVLRGGHDFEGRPVRDDEPSLSMMYRDVRRLEVVTIPESNPGYVLIHKPRECAQTAVDFFTRRAAGLCSSS